MISYIINDSLPKFSITVNVFMSNKTIASQRRISTSTLFIFGEKKIKKLPFIEQSFNSVIFI